MIDAIMRESQPEASPIKRINSLAFAPKSGLRNPPQLHKNNLSMDNRILDDNKIVIATAIENMLIKNNEKSTEEKIHQNLVKLCSKFKNLEHVYHKDKKFRKMVQIDIEAMQRSIITKGYSKMRLKEMKYKNKKYLPQLTELSENIASLKKQISKEQLRLNKLREEKIELQEDLVKRQELIFELRTKIKNPPKMDQDIKILNDRQKKMNTYELDVQRRVNFVGDTHTKLAIEIISAKKCQELIFSKQQQIEASEAILNDLKTKLFANKTVLEQQGYLVLKSIDYSSIKEKDLLSTILSMMKAGIQISEEKLGKPLIPQEKKLILEYSDIEFRWTRNKEKADKKSPFSSSSHNSPKKRKRQLSMSIREPSSFVFGGSKTNSKVQYPSSPSKVSKVKQYFNNVKELKKNKGPKFEFFPSYLQSPKKKRKLILEKEAILTNVSEISTSVIISSPTKKNQNFQEFIRDKEILKKNFFFEIFENLEFFEKEYKVTLEQLLTRVMGYTTMKYTQKEVKEWIGAVLFYKNKDHFISLNYY